MKNSEQQFKQLANSIPQLAWMADASGSLYWYNDRWFDYTGTSLEEMEGWGWKNVHHPDHVARVEEEYRRCLELGSEWEDTFPLRAKDGEYRWFLSRAFPIRDVDGVIVRWFGTNTDITERLAMENQLRESEAFARSILNSSADCIKILDIEGRWLSLNEGGRLALEIEDSSSCQNRPWQEFWPNDGQSLAGQALAHVRDTGAAQFEGFCPTAGGLPKWWEVTLTRIHDANNQPTDKILCVSRDVTLRKTMEMRLQDALAEAQDAHAQAVEANRRKDEFLANMSHELRTPLNAIVGIGHILSKTQPLTEKQDTCVRTLQSSSESLLTLINDLLDLSKIESANVELESIPFSLQKVVGEVVAIAGVAASQKQIGLELKTDSVKLAKVIGDPHRLRQILSNLLSNAIKFTERGGVKLVLQVLHSDAVRMDVAFEVHDTGIGVPPEKLESIFNKFSQADSSITRRYGGTGLGLAISKRLARLMGGDITAESTLGEGSRFTLRLPFLLAKGAESSGLTAVAADALTLTERSPSDRRDVILVVEDYEPNMLVVTSYLDLLGFDYEMASNGAEAIEKAKQRSYRVILMDIQMPGIDGLTATRAIRKWEQERAMRPQFIIGLSAYAFTEDRDKCIKAGMNDYLSKPFTLESLQNKIDAAERCDESPMLAAANQ